MLNEKIAKITINAQIKNTKSTLIQELKSLIKSCTYELERLESEEDYKPNSMGIIQHQTIDLNCATLKTLYDIKNLME